MSRILRKIVASKVTVHADRVDRPKTGSIISRDSATISSRRISKPKLDEKARQIAIVMKDNMQAIIYSKEGKVAKNDGFQSDYNR